MRRPTTKEDAKNLGLIAGSAIVGLALTGALFSGAAPEPTVRSVTVERVEPAPPPAPGPASYGAAVNDRLFGTVHTRSGDAFRGYLRWDRNEGSWADLLDADKRSSGSISGIRFGHVRRIEPRGSRDATFTLKSGEVVDFEGRATDLGSGLRALVVEDPQRGTVELRWRDLDAVEFERTPSGGEEPTSRRLFGTVVTASGEEFTGHVTWDVDEIFTADVLDGEDRDGVDREIPFGEIRSIARNGSRSARVVLSDGRELVLEGSQDVNSSNTGISVSDPGLGQIQVEWNDFDEVRFAESRPLAEYDSFDGGRRIRGTVRTDSGEELDGMIRWDRDETHTWEMLNGESRGVEYNVEFGNIARITKLSGGAEVELRDGRTLRLSDSNDVDRGNRGIVVEREDGSVGLVPWDSFSELRLR